MMISQFFEDNSFMYDITYNFKNYILQTLFNF